MIIFEAGGHKCFYVNEKHVIDLTCLQNATNKHVLKKNVYVISSSNLVIYIDIQDFSPL